MSEEQRARACDLEPPRCSQAGLSRSVRRTHFPPSASVLLSRFARFVVWNRRAWPRPSGTQLGSIGRLGLKMLPAHEGPLSAVFDRNDRPAGGSGGWAVVLKTTARVILSQLGDELTLPICLVPVIRGGEGACHFLAVHMIKG